MKVKQLLAGAFAAAMILGCSVSGFAAGSESPVPEPVPVTPVTPVTPVYPPVYPVTPVTPARPAAAAPARSTGGATTTTTTTAPKKQLYKTDSKIAETPAYKLIKEKNPEITDQIDLVNAGDTDLATMVAAVITDQELLAKLDGKEFVTPFFDLAWVDGVTQAEKDTLKNAEGKYVVDLSIPALTPTLTGVQALHYSTERNTFEVEDTTALDLAKKTISFGLKDFSPVAIIADANSLGE